MIDTVAVAFDLCSFIPAEAHRVQLRAPLRRILDVVAPAVDVDPLLPAAATVRWQGRVTFATETGF